MDSMFYVWDARNNRVSGPYETMEEAKEMASQVNHYVNSQCSFGRLTMSLGGTVVGPFYALSGAQALRQGLTLPREWADAQPKECQGCEEEAD